MAQINRDMTSRVKTLCSQGVEVPIPGEALPRTPHFTEGSDKSLLEVTSRNCGNFSGSAPPSWAMSANTLLYSAYASVAAAGASSSLANTRETDGDADEATPPVPPAHPVRIVQATTVTAPPATRHIRAIRRS